MDSPFKARSITSASSTEYGRESLSSYSPIKKEVNQQVRAQSAQILQRNMMKRLQAREILQSERADKFHMHHDRRENYLRRWKDKTKHSPFQTDLVAESEKITEETQIRQREEEERKQQVIARREKAKSDIILTVS